MGLPGVKAVADLRALPGLAETNHDADFSSYERVLRLLAMPTVQAPALSLPDTGNAAYLKALYTTGQAYKMQRHSIVESMRRAVSIRAQP